MKQLTATLTAVFIALKLAGVINWSWIVVFSPLWGGAILFLIAALFLDAFFSGPYH